MNFIVTHAYGLLLIISIFIGMLYIYLMMRKERVKDNNIFYFFMIYIVFALMCGKIYTAVLINDFSLFSGGFSSYGGLVGVVLAAFIFEKIISYKGILIKYSILSLPLVYSVSKLACFCAGCCHGIPFDSIISITYKNGLNVPVFPIQMVETIVFFVIFVCCHLFRNNKHIIYITFILAIIAKFSLDYLRYDHIGKVFTDNQVFSIILLVCTICLIIYNKFFRKIRNVN